MTTSDAGEGLDPARIALLRDLEKNGAENLLKELVQLFLAAVPLRIQAIRQALAKRDREEVRRQAHLLASGAANLGATAAHASAAELEQWAVNPEWSDPSKILAALEIHLAEACAALPPLAGLPRAGGSSD